MVIAVAARAKRRLHYFVQGSCLLLAGLAALALALYPIYVIRPFREQQPSALQRALWVQLHDKVILFALFLLITLCALFSGDARAGSRDCCCWGRPWGWL